MKTTKPKLLKAKKPKVKMPVRDTSTFELAAFPSGLPEKAKTISTSDLSKLTYVLSEDIPRAVVVLRARRMEYVGIGWIDCGEPQGDEVLVTK